MQQLGIAAEENKTLLSLNLVNGLRYKNFFAGLGLAYEPRRAYFGQLLPGSLPVFVDARVYFFKKKFLFLLGDLGLNHLLFNFEMKNSTYYTYKKQNGVYGNLGMGVKARIGKEVYYVFDICANVKQSRFQRSYRNFLGVETTEYLNLMQNRIVLRLGIEIF